MARKFTKEEIEELEKNPNTLKATASHLSLTKSAKEEVLALVREGLSAYQIVKKLGYDAEMLGKSRCDGIRYCVLKEDEAGHEQREGYPDRRSKRMSIEEIEDLPLDRESVSRMRNELIYLRQEVDFLKKYLRWSNPGSETTEYGRVLCCVRSYPCFASK